MYSGVFTAMHAGDLVITQFLIFLAKAISAARFRVHRACTDHRFCGGPCGFIVLHMRDEHQSRRARLCRREERIDARLWSQ